MSNYPNDVDRISNSLLILSSTFVISYNTIIGVKQDGEWLITDEYYSKHTQGHKNKLKHTIIPEADLRKLINRKLGA